MTCLIFPTITIIISASVVLFEIVDCGQMNLQPFSFGGVNGKYNARAHVLSRFPKSRKSKRPKNPFFSQDSHKAGVKGHAIINGEYMETSRILKQKPTPLGVSYAPYEKPTVPVFIRAEREVNKKYIIFQDPYLPPGEGYLVVLKKIPIKPNIEAQRLMGTGVQPMMPIPTEIPYDAFHLHLSSNIHGTFDRLNVRKFAYGIRTRFSGRRKARRKWLQRRKMKAQSARRRFSLATRWRGKRSADLFNISDLNTPPRRERLHRCFISPLNITHLRLKVESLNAKHSFKDEMELLKDFDY